MWDNADERGVTGGDVDISEQSHSPWPGSAYHVPANMANKNSVYSLRLFGPLELKQREEIVHGFKSAKVRALLAYLAIEAELPQQRSVLASLFWSNWSDTEALANLRSSLYNLRRVLHDRPRIDLSKDEKPYFRSDNQTVQFNMDANAFWIDVWAFNYLTELNCEEPEQVTRCRDAVVLYRGAFLEGFFLKGCPAFEEWLTLKREQFAWKMSKTLTFLAHYYEHQGQYEEASHYLRQVLAMDPWNEITHQQLMRVLYLGGNRAEALRQFRMCCEMLSTELGVEPLEETVLLRNNILAGSL